MNLNDSVQNLKGIGKRRAEILAQANVFTIKDLINYVPSRYENRQKTGSLKDTDKSVTIKAKILKKGSIRLFHNRNKATVLVVPVIDEEGVKGEVYFFNQPYLYNQFRPGDAYYFYGKVTQRNNVPRIFSPKYAPLGHEEFLSIIPVYKKLTRVPASLIQKTVESILNDFEIKDFLPEKYLKKYNLVSLKEMYEMIHFPTKKEEIDKAVRRFKFNEGIKINAGIENLRRAKETTDQVITNFISVEPFIQKLPFVLTDAQKRVLQEIFTDLESGFLMNRMIQGDVGSGKTIIAIICAYLFGINGLQVAYMAPTEILAKQHYSTFKKFFKNYNFRIELLVGTDRKRKNQEIREGLKNGDVNIVIGTHALIQESVEFYNLGLIVTDEQHRFGVKQRGQLESKGNAHILVMSATPIPRSLALTFYGDLDLSVIDQLPAGRKKVRTSIHQFDKLGSILNFTKEEIKLGHQAFVVCPFIEDSEEMRDVVSVEQVYKEIYSKYNTEFEIGLLHSKLNKRDQERIISRFNRGDIDMLVATSIIEVGINIPNVSVIMILSADRFGLSQLHQLRGRTGRSTIQSYCFLVTDNESELTRKRLDTIVNCDDGQEIAEADLKLRGAGDYFGFKQHGFANIKYISPVDDKDLFELCKKAAQEILQSNLAEDMICKDYLIKEFDNDSKFVTLD